MRVYFKRVSEFAKIPVRATEGAAGYDIHSAEQKIIIPHEFAMIKTGFSMEIPRGFEAQIRPRSGLAKKNGITVINTPGTIDEDYRGEVGVLLINHSNEPFVVNIGDRIAQMVFAKVENAECQWAEELSDTARGEGGFGHTKVASL